MPYNMVLNSVMLACDWEVGQNLDLCSPTATTRSRTENSFNRTSPIPGSCGEASSNGDLRKFERQINVEFDTIAREMHM